ncbi:hypothetical protein [Bacillus massilinigeriensis]|uniref:hypothetical protein n=1 Tax=Bacillus massilionigeriensis TaxID=1805475 RepID=UPI00096AF61F|nr:hypothetical protein [Bacillus massilionigeriensis]
MSPFIALFIIILAVLADCFWFDVDKKRWGWMKNWSKLNKGLFFSGFIVISILIYMSLSVKYFN